MTQKKSTKKKKSLNAFFAVTPKLHDRLGRERLLALTSHLCVTDLSPINV